MQVATRQLSQAVKLPTLNNISEAAIYPVGENFDKIQFYELRDLQHNARILVIEYAGPNRDIHVKDAYGDEQFRISGVGEEQIEVFKGKKPVGVFRDKILFRGKELTPTYRMIGRDLSCCLPEKYIIMPIVGDTMEATIYPDAESLQLNFSDTMESDNRGMIIAVAIQIAITKHNINKLDFIRLKKYVYEAKPGEKTKKDSLKKTERDGDNPEKSHKLAITGDGQKTKSSTKSRKSVKSNERSEKKENARSADKGLPYRNRENISIATRQFLNLLVICNEMKLEPTGVDGNGVKYYEFISLDGEDIILMTCEKRDPHKNSCALVIKDSGGRPRFLIQGGMKDGESLRVSIPQEGSQSIIGYIADNTILDSNRKSIFIGEACAPILGCGKVYHRLIGTTSKIPFGYISPDENKLLIDIDQCLSVQSKALVIAYCLKLAFTKYGLADCHLPKVYYLYLLDQNEPFCVEPGHFDILEKPTEIRIRGAGYDRSAIKYFEIINNANNKIFMTCEDQAGRDLVIRDKYGSFKMAIRNAFKPNEPIIIMTGPEIILGSVEKEIFYDSSRKIILNAFKIADCSAMESYRINKGTSASQIGFIKPAVSTVSIGYLADIDECYKAMIIAFGIHLALTKYGLNELPLPLIDYGYLRKTPIRPKVELGSKSRLTVVKKTVTESLERPNQWQPHRRTSLDVSQMIPPLMLSLEFQSPNRLTDLNQGIQLTVQSCSVNIPINRDTANNLKGQVKHPPDFFPGFSALRSIIKVTVKPMGRSEQGIQYYKLIDLKKNRSFLTCECPMALTEDVPFKDRYGKIKFCASGVREQDATMEFYVNPWTYIGKLNNGVFFDHKNAQKMLIKTGLGLFSAPTISIVRATKSRKLLATIIPIEFFNITFELYADDVIKAMVIAYTMQLAMTKYGLDQVRLPIICYVYATSKEDNKALKVADDQNPMVRKQNRKPISLLYFPGSRMQSVSNRQKFADRNYMHNRCKHQQHLPNPTELTRDGNQSVIGSGATPTMTSPQMYTIGATGGLKTSHTITTKYETKVDAVEHKTMTPVHHAEGDHIETCSIRRSTVYRSAGHNSRAEEGKSAIIHTEEGKSAASHTDESLSAAKPKNGLKSTAVHTERPKSAANHKEGSKFAVRHAGEPESVETRTEGPESAPIRAEKDKSAATHTEERNSAVSHTGEGNKTEQLNNQLPPTSNQGTEVNHATRQMPAADAYTTGGQNSQVGQTQNQIPTNQAKDGSNSVKHPPGPQDCQRMRSSSIATQDVISIQARAERCKSQLPTELHNTKLQNDASTIIETDQNGMGMLSKKSNYSKVDPRDKSDYASLVQHRPRGFPSGQRGISRAYDNETDYVSLQGQTSLERTSQLDYLELLRLYHVSDNSAGLSRAAPTAT